MSGIMQYESRSGAHVLHFHVSTVLSLSLAFHCFYAFCWMQINLVTVGIENTWRPGSQQTLVLQVSQPVKSAEWCAQILLLSVYCLHWGLSTEQENCLICEFPCCMVAVSPRRQWRLIPCWRICRKHLQVSTLFVFTDRWVSGSPLLYCVCSFAVCGWKVCPTAFSSSVSSNIDVKCSVPYCAVESI